MTQRFKRKTLAVSIAAALFGGMALAVAPIMTPVAMANQFEAATIDTYTTMDLYTGEPTSSTAAQAGYVRVVSASANEPWRSNGGQFTLTFPAGTVLWNKNGTGAVDITNTNSLRTAFDQSMTGTSGTFGAGTWDGEAEAQSARVDGSGRLLVDFTVRRTSGTNSVNPTTLTITTYAHMADPDPLTVSFADSGTNPLGLGNNPGLQDIKIATFHETSALVTAAAATSVNPGLTNQPVANVTTKLLVQTPDYARILLTLDQGAWVSDIETKVENAGLPGYMDITRLSDTQLELVRYTGRWNTNDQLALSGLQINAVNVLADTDINVTVTSQGDGSAAAIDGFGVQTVKVGRTKGTSGKDVTVGLKTDPTTDVVYVGRREETLTNAVTLTEAMAGTLTANGTLNYTISTGVFWDGASMNVGGTTNPQGAKPTCADIQSTSSAKFECAMGADSSTTAMAVTFTPIQGYLDMLNAKVGDLNVTIDGTAWTNWTSNVVKVADVKQATTSTLDGDVDVLRSGAAGTAPTKATLPDIVIQENNAGALIGGEYFVVAINEGLKLNVLPTTTVKVFNKDGTELSAPLSTRSPSRLIGTGQGDPNEDRGVDVLWTGLPAANGPYKIVISGLQVETVPGTTAAGNYNLSVAGSLENWAVQQKWQSDENAKPYYETFPAVKVVDNLTTTAWVDASGPIDNLSAYANILPGIEARGKQGSYFLMLQMPPLFTGYWSIWTLGPTGWTEVEPATTDPELCSTMTSYQSGTLDDVTNLPLVVDTDMTVFKDVNVFMGYGVGASLFTPLAPCLDMLKNGTYWPVYTVQ